MTNPSSLSLIRDLREQVAAGSPSSELEDRVRTDILPNIVRTYVVPTANEREVISVLKLVSFIAQNFPGVFSHGKAAAVLPVIARIMPFFAESSYSSHLGVVFETLGSLLSLLRIGDRRVYELFFVDAMLVIEDIFSNGSLSIYKLDTTSHHGVNLKCFALSFSQISDDPSMLHVLPTHLPDSGFGLTVNIFDRARCLLFATWTIRLINKYLTDGFLYVNGLVSMRFVYAASAIWCHGDHSLHMACFDFIRIAAAKLNPEFLPMQNIILSILVTYRVGLEEPSSFRNSVYDSFAGACLHALYSACPEEAILYTSDEFIHIFPKAVNSTESEDFKAALCFAYVRVAKLSPISTWKPIILLDMICAPFPCLSLITCIRAVLDLFGSDVIGESIFDGSSGCFPSSTDGFILSKRTDDFNQSFVGKKRIAQASLHSKQKRQKIDTNENARVENAISAGTSSCEQTKDNVIHMHRSLLSLIAHLKPSDLEDEFLKPEAAVMGLCILCIAFCKYPYTNMAHVIFDQVFSWMPWVYNQVKDSDNLNINFNFQLYLEAVRDLFLIQVAAFPMAFEKSEDSLDKDGSRFICISQYEDVCNLIKLMWKDTTNDVSLVRKKCISVQIFSLICAKLKLDSYLQLLELAITDAAEEVRAEAATSLPLVAFLSEFDVVHRVYKNLQSLASDKSDCVIRSISQSVGYLSCFQGAQFNSADSDDTSCKLVLSDLEEVPNQFFDLVSRGFWCSQCDKEVMPGKDCRYEILCINRLLSKDATAKVDLIDLQSIFLNLICSEASEDNLLLLVAAVSRILRHETCENLQKRRSQWIQCVDVLLVHKNKGVREAFRKEIGVFTEARILACVFCSDSSHENREQRFLERIKQAFTTTNDVQILVSILKLVSEVMKSTDIYSRLYLSSLIMLIDQLDSPYKLIRVTATSLMITLSYIHVKGGFNQFISRYSHVRDEVFDYLCSGLATRPEMIRIFAERVLGIETTEFCNKMVPVVLPKILVHQKDKDHALATLNIFAKQFNTEAFQLMFQWVPNVLSFALFEANEQELESVLQFYHVQTNTDRKEVFSVALSALLDELVCFEGNGDLEKIQKRTEKIPHVIQIVSRIVTGSDDLQGFLRDHFVGLLNSVDRRMLQCDNQMVQKQALLCIRQLIQMMGSNLSMYAPKITVLLTYAVERESLQAEGLAVLSFFVKQLARRSSYSAGHVISQVVAALIPSLEHHCEVRKSNLERIVKVLEKMIVENRHLLEQHICELPLLPTIPVLSKVNNVIQETRGSMSLRDQLRDAVTGLNHESLNVRYMVASELSKFLVSRREDITTLIVNETVLDLDILSSLITSLLKGCAEESRTSVGQKLKLICLDCLGALGAIDPAKFRGISCQRFKIECSDDDLMFELIDKHLARAFRAASDATIQDSAALAIQELLKLAGCQSSLDENLRDAIAASNKKDPLGSSYETGSRGLRLWDRFSIYVKDIIAPCLTSRFQLPTMTAPVSSRPIYQPSMSFRRWISSWIRDLIVHATGSRASIFKACRGIVRHDMQTAVYLLPYLVLNAICHGTVDARNIITVEILSVLNAAALDYSKSADYGTKARRSEVCIQAIFTLLDNLGQWVDDIKQEVALSQSANASISKHQSKTKCSESNAQSDLEHLLVQCTNVSELLAAIPKVTLAKTSYHCQAYARALLYFESHVQEKAGSFNPAAECSGNFDDEDISFLMEIYSELDEPDGLSGLANLRRSLNLNDQLLINEKAGNWAEVLTISEQSLQMEPASVERHSGVLNCLLNMCNLQAMVTHVDGLISRAPQYRKIWSMHGVQAAWRLGRWDLMDEYLDGADTDWKEGSLFHSYENTGFFDMDLAKILQAIIRKDQQMVAERIAYSKKALLVPLAAAGMDSYMRAYPFVVKLHMLHELEDFHSLLGDDSFLERSFDSDDLSFCELVKHWDNRLKITQSSIWAREPLLAFRRLVFSSSKMGNQVGNCWLQYAKLCRSADHYETAHRALLEAQASDAPNVHMEKAKLLWSTRKSDCAIAELQQFLLNVPADVLGTAAATSLASCSLVPLNPPSMCPTQVSNENFDVAKMMLLYTRWIHHTGQKQKEDVISLYSRVRDLQPNWEKGYFFTAKYCDDLLVDARKRQEVQGPRDVPGPLVMPTSSSMVGGSSNSRSQEEPWWFHLPDVLLSYAKGLNRGHKHLFQALPRLLTLWFEFSSMYRKEIIAANKDLKTVYTRVMSIMRGCLKDLPTYQWLIVLSQLISRICHQNEDTVRIVKHIIISVIMEYPQQSLWMMAAVSKSTIAARRDAAAEIIQSARKGSKHGKENNLFVQFANVIDHLIKLCFHPGQPKSRVINIATEFSALKRMMPLGIIMPVQQALTVCLPSSDSYQADALRHNIFSSVDLVTISGIADEAEILSSLQKPKKVNFLGSDGVYRPFLCKPKDDLRKDARMMEFTAMINHLLSKFPESRRRKLYIRTFSVIPLTEDCGMVEWVPNTRGLRLILQDIYVTCGKFDRQKTNPVIKRIYDQCQGKMPEDEMLRHKILPMFPPVFRKWFVTMFSEPAAWFRARIAYAHTAAVWSMVGHIVGLGDRHGENILFDSTSGDCVHVDFSCLFDKGLQLEKPELVPFRLTQNMIDGLGITGYEGVFLKVCEITLSVLRTNRETLTTVLETFIHDPLVEWTKHHKSSGIEVQNPHAQRAISNIKARLQGVLVGVRAAPSLPLAVEGQARRLIAEAVSLKNLGKMYIWWMAWF